MKHKQGAIAATTMPNAAEGGSLTELPDELNSDAPANIGAGGLFSLKNSEYSMEESGMQRALDR